jgi:hypothetical protein
MPQKEKTWLDTSMGWLKKGNIYRKLWFFASFFGGFL